MKLYAFRPDGHGQDSFFIIAHSEIEARKHVSEFIETKKKEGPLNVWSVGWGTDYYIMTVYEIGEVATNDN